MLAPLLVAMPVIGVLASVGQVGLLLSGKSLAPDLDRGQPDGRLQAPVLAAHRRGVAQDASLKLGIVGWLLYRAYLDSFPIFLSLAGADLPGALRLFIDTAFSMAMTVGAAFLVLAMLDYGYQRWEFLRGARMTKQELKEEYRQSEGAPEIRAAIRRRQKRHGDVPHDAERPEGRCGRHQSDPLCRCIDIPRRRDGRPEGDRQGPGPHRPANQADRAGARRARRREQAARRALYAPSKWTRRSRTSCSRRVAQVLAYIYALKRRPSQAVQPAWMEI